MKQPNITGSRKEYYIKKLEFDYDKSNDLLYICRKGSNIYSNVVVGEFHLEFSKDKKIVGIEVLKASEILGEYGIPKKILENIDKVELKIVVKGNSMLVFIIIHALNQEKSAAITMNNLESPIMKALVEA
ncbi:DUF2283 domain-containing protein [Candidatus Woesearchaeota archaeon]|nr:DUF2283 domain-containing protein [Candidatus Woesearchaeota archaeon]